MASITRTVLAAIPISILQGYENRLVKLEFPPGIQGPVHTHPIAGIVHILHGDLVSQYEGDKVERYTKGDTLLDRAHENHIYSYNPSKTEPLIFIASYVVKIGEPNIVIS